MKFYMTITPFPVDISCELLGFQTQVEGSSGDELADYIYDWSLDTDRSQLNDFVKKAITCIKRDVYHDDVWVSENS